MRGRRSAARLILVAGLSGCASFRPDAGFDEVSKLVSGRVGKDVVWSTGTEQDQQVAARVRTLLREQLAVEDVVEITLLNNLELQATYQDLGISQADVVQAGLLSNPSLGIERRFPGQALEADVSQAFLSVFLIPLRLRVSGAEFEAAKLRVAEDVVKHAFEARAAYFALQSELQVLELRRTVLGASEAAVEAARRLRAAGNVPLLDVANEELLAAEARLEVAVAEGEVVERRERLNRLMGLWGDDTVWTIANRLPELPADDGVPEGLERVAIENRLDLTAARRELEGLAERLGIARVSALLPELTLTGHFEREPEGDNSSGPSLDLPIPLFNWGRAATGQAQARLLQAHHRFAAQAIEIRSQVRAAYARMNVARARAAYYRDRVLPLSQQALHQTQLQYNGMFVGVFQLLQAKRSQVEAAKKYIEALASYWTSRTELESSLGKRLPTPEARPALTPLPAISESEPADSSGGHEHHHSH